MIFLVIILFVFSLLISAGESYYEHDWPRDTGKFTIFSFFLLMLTISVFG